MMPRQRDVPPPFKIHGRSHIRDTDFVFSIQSAMRQLALQASLCISVVVMAACIVVVGKANVGSVRRNHHGSCCKIICERL